MPGNVILVAEVLTTVQVFDATGDNSSTKGDIQKNRWISGEIII